jgi:hypothetical protein
MNDGPSKEIAFRLRCEDIETFLAHRKAQATNTRSKINNAVIGGIICILFTALFYYQLGLNPSVAALATATAILNISAFQRLIDWNLRGPKRDLELTLRQGARRGLLKDQSITISPQGLSQVLEHSDASLDWPVLENVIVTPGHIFFMTTATTAVILPRHAFGGEREFEEYAGLAKRYFLEANSLANSGVARELVGH